MRIISSPIVEILSFTPNAEKIIELAGRNCYSSEDKITETSSDKFIKSLIRRGHEGVLEHAAFTVRISDISRGAANELVRHRLASYCQRSTRYTREDDLGFVIPPGMNPLAEIKNGLTIIDSVQFFESLYADLLKMGYKPEDARQFLPIGTASNIVMTTNFREWRTIFKLRCDKTAHWEIRKCMKMILRECLQRWPVVFADLSELADAN